MSNPKKIKLKTIFFAVVILAVFLLITILGVNYFVGKNNFLSKIGNKFIPFPVVIIDYSHLISLKNLETNLLSAKKFYESQDFAKEGLRVDFNTADGEKRLAIKEKNILNKMIENVLVEELAKEKGIKLSEEFISQEVERKILELGNRAEVKDSLLRLYGWNLEQFKERIVRPELYKEKLAEKVLVEMKDFENAQKKIDGAASELKNKGKFEELAAKYSEGESAKNGGDLGWFTADQMLPEIATAAFQMEKGKTSEVLRSELGFHIIRIDDKKIENEIPMIKVHQIFVRTPSFADWLLTSSKKFNIRIMLQDYSWNKEKQQVEFRDGKLTEFEKNLITNSPGDVSVIF